jgi:putative nucleotidyltransferase with HDIG domain
MKPIFSFLINRHQDILRITLFAIAIGLIGNWFPKSGKFKYEYEKGQIWKYETLYAPFSFAIQKSKDSLATERANLLSQFAPYYRLQAGLELEHTESLKKSYGERYRALRGDSTMLQRIRVMFRNQRQDSLTHLNTGLAILDRVYDKGIIQIDGAHADLTPESRINVLDRRVAEERTINEFYTLAQAFQFVLDSLDEANATFLAGLLEDHIAPNIYYDDSTTELIQANQLEYISLNYGMIKDGSTVVEKGTLVTEEKFQRLLSLESEYEARQLGDAKALVVLGGYLLLAAILLSLLGIYLWLFEPDVFFSIRKLTFTLLLIVASTLFVYLANSRGTFNLYVIPYCIVPIMIRTFFGSRMALYVHLTNVLIAGFIVPYGLDYVFLHLMAGVIAILANVKAYYWSQFILSGALILATYITTYLGISLVQEGDLQTLNWSNFGWLALNSLIVLLAYLLIPLFEKIFGFVSDISLMELADTNRPLLKELSLKAPGTFNHSLQVANLAEAAAYEIGASTILVRVGSLYHDIGKLDQPIYFIENQNTEVNPHDELPYDESAAIIINHVSKGIEIAKKHKLPDPIIDFIRTHHGTSRVEYFYRSFLKNFPDEEVDVSRFTYPGPLPYSRETAIVMMADSVEAASRSMKSPSKADIDELVDVILKSKMEQGQFNNCGITFKDITTINKTFKKMLKSVYHVRVAYNR